MKVKKMLITLIVAIVFLSGCWDAKEIEKQFLVWGMGWDKSEDNSDNLTLTLSSPTTAQNAKDDYITVTSAGDSVEDAKSNAQAQLYRSIEMGHMRILIIGEDLAKEGIQKLLDSLGRNPRINRETTIAVVKGKAADVWEIEHPSNPLPSGYVVNLIKTNSHFSNAHNVTFRDFFEALSRAGEEPVTPYLTISKDEKTINAKAIAVFKGNKMVGTLDDEELRAFEMIINELDDGTYTIGQVMEGTEDSVTVSFRTLSTEIKSEVKGDTPYINLTIQAEVDIIEQTSLVSAVSEEYIKGVEKNLTAQLQREVTKTIKKVQKEYKSDIFGFGRYFRAYHTDFWKSHKWSEEFPNLKVDSKIKVYVRRVGIER
mgnify:FL=1